MLRGPKYIEVPGYISKKAENEQSPFSCLLALFRWVASETTLGISITSKGFLKVAELFSLPRVSAQNQVVWAGFQLLSRLAPRRHLLGLKNEDSVGRSPPPPPLFYSEYLGYHFLYKTSVQNFYLKKKILMLNTSFKNHWNRQYLTSIHPTGIKRKKKSMFLQIKLSSSK